ncbi:MAG: helix-hairpin-helix domain-containing protein [Bacteroidota bacterium]
MWKKLHYLIRDHFAFSNNEAKAFRSLLLAMALLLVMPMAWRTWVTPHWNTYESDQTQLDSLVAELKIRHLEQKARPRFENPNNPQPEARLFAFDPNAISSNEWQQLGLKKYLSERIINYRSKGGKFRVKKDLMKIFGFPADRYAALEAYIQLPDSLPKNQAFAKNGQPFPPRVFPAREDFRPHPFDLNTVDTVQLEKLKGIGPALARRIVKYRDRLGGFVSLAQVSEVYGMDSTLVKEVLIYGSLKDKNGVKKININSATVEELRQHPYLSPRLATVIVAYRRQHGAFAQAQALTQIKILDANTLRKLEPYLAF